MIIQFSHVDIICIIFLRQNNIEYIHLFKRTVNICTDKTDVNALEHANKTKHKDIKYQ